MKKYLNPKTATIDDSSPMASCRDPKPKYLETVAVPLRAKVMASPKLESRPLVKRKASAAFQEKLREGDPKEAKQKCLKTLQKMNTYKNLFPITLDVKPRTPKPMLKRKLILPQNTPKILEEDPSKELYRAVRKMKVYEVTLLICPN